MLTLVTPIFGEVNSAAMLRLEVAFFICFEQADAAPYLHDEIRGKLNDWAGVTGRSLPGA